MFSKLISLSSATAAGRGASHRRKPSARARRHNLRVPLSKVLVVCGWLICLPMHAQELAPPPDYGDNTINVLAEETAKAWQAWQRLDRDIEQNAFQLAMVDGRETIQRSLSALLNYLGKRKAYSEGVAKYIEQFRPEASARKPIVAVETVSREQLELLGATLTDVQARLKRLTDSPDWSRIRRSVVADTSGIDNLRKNLRNQIPLDLPLSKPEPPHQMSVIVYRDSERQIAELLEKLWTDYYQALDNAVERKPDGAKPLMVSTNPASAGPSADVMPASPAVVSGTHPAVAPAAGATSLPGQPSAPAASEALVGTWRYIERSQQFNGVEEPRQVLIEIWVEKGGALAGRYRAVLADFDGPHNVDIALQSLPAGKNPKEFRFHYRAASQDADGQLTIEGPGTSGTDLTISHDGGGVPRGREIVLRR